MRHIIALAGASGAGKSTVARAAGIATFPCDAFFRDIDDGLVPQRRHGKPDWDHPDAYNTVDAGASLLRLLTAGVVRVPVYDFALDRKVGFRDVILDGSLAIVEGIYAFEVIDQLVLRPQDVKITRVLLKEAVPVLVRSHLRRDHAERGLSWLEAIANCIRLVLDDRAYITTRCAAAELIGYRRRLSSWLQALAT